MISLRFSFFVLLAFLASCSLRQQFQVSDIFVPLVKFSENQNACLNSASLEILIPQTIEGKYHSYTLFQLKNNDGNGIFFEAYLSGESDGNKIDVPICIGEEYLSNAVFFVAYGVRECLGYEFGFLIDDLSHLPQVKIAEMASVQGLSNACR